MTWVSIIIAGIITYFTRMTMIALVSRDMLGEKTKAVLAYVPSAVFPAIIFPAIFINDYGSFIEMNDPKIFGAITAVFVGYFTRNIIATILYGIGVRPPIMTAIVPNSLYFLEKSLKYSSDPNHAKIVCPHSS